MKGLFIRVFLVYRRWEFVQLKCYFGLLQEVQLFRLNLKRVFDDIGKYL